MAVLSFRPVESNPWLRGHFWAANPQHLALFMCFLSCKNTQYISIEQKVLFLEYLQFEVTKVRFASFDQGHFFKLSSKYDHLYYTQKKRKKTAAFTPHKLKKKRKTHSCLLQWLAILTAH